VPLKPVSLQPLTPGNIDSVVELHLSSLSYSINSKLGFRHLTNIYKRMAADSDSLIAVATAEQRTIGVVSATLNSGTLRRQLIAEASPAEKLSLLGRMLLHPSIFSEWIQSRSHSQPVIYKDAIVNPCLTAIAVATNVRRHGVGRTLIEAVDKFVQSSGNLAYFLETRSINEASRNFYAKMGFVEVEQRGRDIVLIKEVAP